MSSNRKPTQLVLGVKDIMRITGKSERLSREVAQKIRALCGKSKDEDITVVDICKYLKITIEEYKLFHE